MTLVARANPLHSGSLFCPHRVYHDFGRGGRHVCDACCVPFRISPSSCRHEDLTKDNIYCHDCANPLECDGARDDGSAAADLAPPVSLREALAENDLTAIQVVEQMKAMSRTDDALGFLADIDYFLGDPQLADVSLTSHWVIRCMFKTKTQTFLFIPFLSFRLCVGLRTKSMSS